MFIELKRNTDQGVEISNIGWGFLIAESEGCSHLLHKSGVLIIETCYDDFKIVGNNFIAAQKGNVWRLYTLTGRALDVD